MYLQSILKRYSTPLKFLNSTLILHGVNLLLTFVVYRYVAPDLMGIWATFATYSTIATIIRLGIPNGMNRELPYYLGKGDVDLAKQYASNTLFYTIVTSVVLLLIGIVYFFTNDFETIVHPQEYKTAAVCFFVQLITEPYITYLSGTFRTNSQFDRLSNIQIYLAIIRIVTIFLVIKWGFYGYIIRELAATCINLGMLHLWRPLKDVKPSFSWIIMKGLFVVGFPIFISSYLSSFIDTFPRLYIIREGGVSAMGLFSPVVMSLSIVYLIPNTISSYLYPKFSSRYGQSEGNDFFWKKMKSMLLLSLGIGVVAYLLIYFLIDYLIQLFPNYLDSVPYIKQASVAMIFIGYKIASVICVVYKKWNWLWISLIAYFVFQSSSILLLNIFIDDKLSVASNSLSVTYSLMFVLSFYYVYKITHSVVKNE